jgi:hypothetical protein
MDISGLRLVTCTSRADESSNPRRCRPSQCRRSIPGNSATELHSCNRDEIEPKCSKYIHYVRSHIGGAQNVAAEVRHNVIIPLRRPMLFCPANRLCGYLQFFKILYATVIRRVVEFRHLIDLGVSGCDPPRLYDTRNSLHHEAVFQCRLIQAYFRARRAHGELGGLPTDAESPGGLHRLMPPCVSSQTMVDQP